MKSLSKRECLMLAGMFLSKFNREGLQHLGFSSLWEAYNAMGYALGGKPTSIKNYRQEFDPLFPNNRKGWHKRELRPHCRDAFERFGQLSMLDFSRLLSPLLLPPVMALPESLDEIAAIHENEFENECFSRRLITGAAAEGFFESSFPYLSEFSGHVLTNVTRYGCGFDFRLQPVDSHPFIAVEVKGIAGAGGDVMMTSKEHQVADYLQDRYYLCIVRNFTERPVLSLFRNPLVRGLEFTRRERQQITETWHAKVPA